MEENAILIKKLKIEQLDSVVSLLKSFNLVYEDIKAHFVNFSVALDNNKIIGCAGFEKHDEIGLLRSVAVSLEFQGKGVGHMLIKSILKNAEQEGIKVFYLLTDTASSFFSKFGFKIVSRTEVDERIKTTYEYSEACSEKAIVMIKHL